MPITDAEVQAAIEKLVQTSIRKPIDSLGTRNVSVPFNDMQQAAAGVFILHPHAPYYVLALGAAKLLSLLTGEATLIQNLLEAIAARGNKTFPVSDLTPLGNAHAALVELQGAVGSRTNSFTSVETVPAYVRFKSNVQKFLKDNGSNVKLNGELVITPEEAKNSIPQLLTQLKTVHQEAQTRAALLLGGIDNFNQVNLPSLVAESVVTNATSVLKGHLDDLNTLSPTDRLNNLKTIVLDLVTSQAVVQQYGSSLNAGDSLTVNGLGGPFADLDHPATPASLTTSLPGPYNLLSASTGVPANNLLDLFIDVSGYPITPKYSGTVTTITSMGTSALLTHVTPIFSTAVVNDVVYITSGLNQYSRWVTSIVNSPTQVTVLSPTSTTTDAGANIILFQGPTESVRLASGFMAELRSQFGDDATATPPHFQVDPVNNHFILQYSESGAAPAVADIGLAPGTYTTEEVVGLFNAGIAGYPLVPVLADSFFALNKFSNFVNITGGALTLTATLLSGSTTGYNLKSGDELFVRTGVNAGTRWTISIVTLTSVTAIGTATTMPETSQLVDMGKDRRLRLYVPPSTLAMGNQARITILDDPTSSPQNSNFGFFPGITSTSRAVTPKEVAADVGGKSTQVTATTTLIEGYDGLAHTDPLQPNSVVLYTWRGKCDVTAVGGGGPGSYTVTVDLSRDPNPPPAGLLTGGLFEFFSGGTAVSEFDIGLVNGNIITGVVGQTPATLGTNIDIEFGPSTAFSHGQLVRIPSGINAGDYTLDFQDSTFHLRYSLVQALPQFSNLGQVVLVPNLLVGAEYLTLSSKLATTKSYTLLRETVPTFTSSLQAEGFMGTPYFQIPAGLPQALVEGDLLELYISNYNTPDFTYIIQRIDTSANVFQVDRDIKPPNPSYTFTASTPPFARLRVGKAIDFAGFKKKLSVWSTDRINEASYFTNLDRLINPILVNASPTAVELNSARNQVLLLVGRLTLAGATLAQADPALSLENILNSYTVPSEPSVDTMLKAFTERGADRAIDLLVEGQFTSFFSLAVESSTYTGDLLSKMRTVARSDLVMSKTDRPDVNKSRQTAAADSPDYEYDTSDTAEAGTVPNPPPEQNS